uniref:Uncharacterized protein n=1 Tax=Ditylum brightwellii TaxID=49249 RepID=A0A7S4SFK8_9STRA
MNGGAQFNSVSENGHDHLVNALIEERSDTATLSIVAELMDDSIQDRASPPAPHNKLSNENIALRNPMARNNRTRGFGGCALRTLPQAELDQDEMLPLQQKIALAKSRAVMGEGKTPASFSVLPVQDDVGPAFQIFCDKDEENEHLKVHQTHLLVVITMLLSLSFVTKRSMILQRKISLLQLHLMVS